MKELYEFFLETCLKFFFILKIYKENKKNPFENLKYL